MKEHTNEGLYLKQFTVLLILFLSLNFLQAQTPETITVRGKVISSEDNKPLSGVSILEKTTGKGTSTDTTGNYTFSIGRNATLLFEHIGFSPMEVAVSGRNSIDITLQLDRQQLTDVILVGYGNQKKRNITCSISTLAAKDLIPGPASSFDQMLQGKVAGAQIT